MLDRLRGLPGIEEVSAVSSTPLAGGWSGIPYMVEGQEVQAGESIVGGYRAASPEYFEVLSIPLLAGRRFTEADERQGENVAIVNQAFVKHHWPDGSALDRMILNHRGEEFARIVGVAGDTRFALLTP